MVEESGQVSRLECGLVRVVATHYNDSDMKYPMNDVASSTTNLLSLLFLTNTDTTWSFCGWREEVLIAMYTTHRVHNVPTCTTHVY